MKYNNKQKNTVIRLPDDEHKLTTSTEIYAKYNTMFKLNKSISKREIRM